MDSIIETMPKYLCHYTSVDVLLELFTNINDDNFYFHASSVDFMNDSTEYMISKEHCCDIINEMQMEINLGIPYALCFSNSEDNIPMWKMYADSGKGICLMFDFDELNQYFERLKQSTKNVFNCVKFSYCRYEEKEIQNDNEKPLFAYNANYNNEQLKELMITDAFIKPKSFQHENEWRLMVWQDWRPSDSRKMLFKMKKSELCPYVRIPIPIKSLRKIILCPSASQSMENSVKYLSANYAERYYLAVEKSEITLKV